MERSKTLKEPKKAEPEEGKPEEGNQPKAPAPILEPVDQEPTIADWFRRKLFGDQERRIFKLIVQKQAAQQADGKEGEAGQAGAADDEPK